MFHTGTTPQCTTTYTIKAGNTCWDLTGAAGGFGLPEGQAGVDKLLQLNPGLNCNLLQIGQIICVQGSTSKHTLDMGFCVCDIL